MANIERSEPYAGLMHLSVAHGDTVYLAGIVADDLTADMAGQTRDVLRQLDERAGIPVQHQVMLNFGSDGKAFMANDVPSALLCVATRSTHRPIETIDVDDLVGVVRLLEAFVTAEEARG